MEERIRELEELKNQVALLIKSLSEDLEKLSELQDDEGVDFVGEAIDSLQDVEDGLQNAWSCLIALPE